MKVTVSRLGRPGPLVVVNTPDNTALVLAFEDPDLPAIHDLTDSAPDLVLLALSEPPVPSDIHIPLVTPGHVSLVTTASIATGTLEMADEDAQSRCFAAAVNPFTGETDVLELATVLTLIAAGAAVQISAGWAATAARNLDAELEHLDDWR
jgi:hypothetical protein